MDDFELSLSANNGSLVATPHRSMASLHAVPEHDQQQHHDQREQQAREYVSPLQDVVSPAERTHATHSRFPSSRAYQSRRQTNTSTTAIHVPVDSFQRQAGNGNNGYYDHQHAAVLDAFDDYRRQRPKRRTTKYSVQIRGAKRGDHEHVEQHWSLKQRFVPNGEITNFVPEFKPLRRPSYRAHLQAIKDREKRNADQLEKFHADRLRHTKLHAEQWMNKLRHKQVEKEQQEQLQLQQQHQVTATMTPTSTSSIAQSLQNMSMLSGIPAAAAAAMAQAQPVQQERAPNQSRTNYLFSQNTTNLLPSAASKPSPPAALNVNLLTGTPPLNALPYPLLQYSMSQKAQTPTLPLPEFQQRLQQQTQQILNTQNAAQLNVTSAPWAGPAANWNPQPQLAATRPTTTTNAQISPTDAHNNNNHGNNNHHNNDTKSSTVTPQTNPLVHSTMPESINLSDVNTVAFAGNNNNSNAVSTQQTLQRTQPQQQLHINLMGQMGFPQTTTTAAAASAAPIQFSQQLYQQQQQRQQQIWQQQQQQAQSNDFRVQAAAAAAHRAQAAQQQQQQQQQQQWNASPVQQPMQIQYAQDFDSSSYHSAQAAQPGMYGAQWNAYVNQYNANNNSNKGFQTTAQHNQWSSQNQPQNWNQYGRY